MSHKRTLLALIGLTAGMFAFSFALVPLYDLFCDITGLNGKVSGPSEAAAEVPASGRPLTIRPVTEKGNGIPWDFKAEQTRVEVEVGRPHTIYFHARNRSDEHTVGRAIPSVSPGVASKWLRKTECFCFQKQPLGPGEEARFAMNFYFTDELPEEYRDIVIGYTLYDITPRAEDKRLTLSR